MGHTVVIECPECDTKVRADILAMKEFPTTNEYDSFIEYYLQCPGCLHTMVAYASMVQTGLESWDYEDKPTRLWPNPERSLDRCIPKLVRASIEEARLCLRVKANCACAVMCGRALEAVCKAQGVKNWQLTKGWQELKDRGVIDERLYEWGDSLRKRRNIGAHAAEEGVTREDAIDVLDFSIAICEYIYVLAKKYEDFKAREAKSTSEQ